MHPAPIPNEDEIGTQNDELVADPLSANLEDLWNNTARRNREIFTEVFRPVPTNLVRSWSAYEVSSKLLLPKLVRLFLTGITGI
jgi:phospholipase D1/2